MARTKEDSLQVDLADEIESEKAGAVVAVGIYQNERNLPDALRRALPEWVRTLCEGALESGEFDAEESASELILAGGESVGGDGGAASSSNRRLLLVGLGARADFTLRGLRRASSVAVRAAQEAKARELQILMPRAFETTDASALADAIYSIADGAIAGTYENDFYKNKTDDETSALERVTVIAREANEAGRAAIERARIVAEAANWARALVDEPGASLPPREFARRAAEMAAEFGLKVETLNGDAIRACGMGGLAGVAQGSVEEPQMIVVRYEPEDAPEDTEVWAFVGKGVTFDTGGISIKPAARMEEMKGDMAGGAAVLGALRALAQLKPKRRIIGVAPSTENMPSGRALKPGDVIETFAGRTIEVVDTDAEGRLILVDAIAYAKHLGATRIVDLATLTGSIIIALGDHRAGLFSNDDEWAQAVLSAAERACEPAWRMPVGDDYKKRIESDIADYKNYGGRPDATGAALLLSKFAGDTPWVHLDIAATASLDEAQAYAPAGATGAGVRTLVELATGVSE